MKRMLSLCAAMTLVMSFVGCGDDDEAELTAHCEKVVTCDITNQEMLCDGACKAMQTCDPACAMDGTEYCDPCTGTCTAVPEVKTCDPACTAPQVCNPTTGACMDVPAPPVCTPACGSDEVCTY
ncbi:MAG: hypothetical protein JRH20_31170 [Deltaproteobacteria bacterium]|nr:hypothetical protein [Deltaproteobacteria bacterium]